MAVYEKVKKTKDLKIRNLSGQRFGRLIAFEQTDERLNGEVVWKCNCDCGGIKKTVGSRLKSGAVKSCGCALLKVPLGELDKKCPELKGVRKEVVQDGVFTVYENGRIFKKTEFGLIECSIYKTNNYQVVSANVGGKQKHYYVHRLLSEAFIPNPDNKPQVNHKDGNRSNNKLSNLEWSTAKENVQHAYRTGLAHPFKNSEPCVFCGNPTRSKDEVCAECKKEENKKLRIKESKEKIKESISHLDSSYLTSRQSEILSLRKKGMTYEEIGRSLGISKQAVQNSLKTSEKRSTTKTELTKTEIKEMIRLENRISKKRLKKEKMLLDITLLDEEIKNTERRLEGFKSLVDFEL